MSLFYYEKFFFVVIVQIYFFINNSNFKLNWRSSCALLFDNVQGSSMFGLSGLFTAYRDYGDKESKVIQNTVGNMFSGLVVGETAKTLNEPFGKVLQQLQSITINHNDKSTSISTQMDSLIPARKISNLMQGMFVGAVSDNFNERINQKIFHAEIVVDSVKVSAEMKTYQPIPMKVDFKNEDGSDNLKESIDIAR